MLYYFLLISLFFNTYSMQFDKINLPLEIFSNTLNCCFRIPTHIEEILEQDKKLFSFRLVCKKWENCFNAVFLMRLNTINFKSMEYLFVQERHYDTRFFKYWYCKRINHLQRTTAIFHAQDLFILLSNEKKQIDNYQIESDEYEYNKTTNYSIFDWEIVSRLSYERPYHCDPKRPDECSFDQIYNYFANSGFISNFFIERLVCFLVDSLNYDAKTHTERNIGRMHKWRSVVLYIYFYSEEFNKTFLNMNFSYFFTSLLLQLNQNYYKNYKNKYPLKKVFEDFKNLDFEINYGEFIENLNLSYYEYRKTVIKIFFNKFRNYFCRNYFELNLFLEKLLLYRLRYYESYNIESDNDKKLLYFFSIHNINSFILSVIKEFKKEIENFSMERKKNIITIFYSNKNSLLLKDFSYHSYYYNKFNKCNKKEKAIAEKLNACVGYHQETKQLECSNTSVEENRAVKKQDTSNHPYDYHEFNKCDKEEQVIAEKLNACELYHQETKQLECSNTSIEENRAVKKQDTFKKDYRYKKVFLYTAFFISIIFFKKLFSKFYTIYMRFCMQ